MKNIIVATVTLMLAGMTGAASAEAVTPSAVTVANLSMRAGPGTSFPVVHALSVHTGVTINGCNAGTSWCDVGFGRTRGLVSARYLQVVDGCYLQANALECSLQRPPRHGHWHQYSHMPPVVVAIGGVWGAPWVLAGLLSEGARMAVASASS